MSNSRNLASLLRADGSVEPTKYTDEIGGVADFVASGILPNGVPVVLKDDGTVEAVTYDNGAASIPQDTATVLDGAYYGYQIAFDNSTSGSFVLSHKGTSNTDTFIMAGTLSGTTLTFGSVVNLSTGGIKKLINVSAGKFLISHLDASYNAYCRVIEVSGTTVTTSATSVLMNTGNADMVSLSMVPNTTKFVATYQNYASSSHGTARVGTISGTSISFGTAVVFNAAATAYVSSSIDANTSKLLVTYKDEGNSGYATARVGTVSGTSISFGTESVITSDTCLHVSSHIDPSTSGSVVVVYKRNSLGKGKVGVISGTSVTWGAEFEFASGDSSYNNVMFNPSTAGQFAVTHNTTSKRYITLGTVSGTSATFGSATEVYPWAVTSNTIAFNPFVANQFLTAFRTVYEDSYIGRAVLGKLATAPSTNLTADNFIGMSSTSYSDGETATVTLAGSVSDNQSGLTTNSVYYVQTDGTLSTAGTPSVEAGRAISSTSLLLTSEAGAAGAGFNFIGVLLNYSIEAGMAIGSSGTVDIVSGDVFRLDAYNGYNNSFGDGLYIATNDFSVTKSYTASGVNTSLQSNFPSNFQVFASDGIGVDGVDGEFNFIGTLFTYSITAGPVVGSSGTVDIVDGDVFRLQGYNGYNNSFGDGLYVATNNFSVTKSQTSSGINAELQSHFSTNFEFFVGDGATGADGAAGADGATGADGAAGADGATGADGVGGVADFIASGILPNGQAVILKDDGTVEAVAVTDQGLPTSIPAGAEYAFSSTTIAGTSVAFDPNNAGNFVIVYRDDANSYYGTAVAGIVSGTSISFGSPTIVFSSFANFWKKSVAFDPNNSGKFLVVGVVAPGQGTAIVGTQSGTSISFGSPTVFNSGTNSTSSTSVLFDPNDSGKFVVVYRDDGNSYYGATRACTVSGNSISVGPETVFKTSHVDTPIAAFDPNNAGKFVIAYAAQDDTFRGKVVVATVSGTSISVGPEHGFYGGSTSFHDIACDPNTSGAFIVTFKVNGNGHARLFTISGTTATWGASGQFASPFEGDMQVAYDPNTAGKFIIAYKSANYGEVLVGTEDNTSISFAASDRFNNGASDFTSVSFDPNNIGKFIVAYRDNGNSSRGTAIVGQIGHTNISTNLTASNFIGMSSAAYADADNATIVLAGGVSDDQTGLSTNSVYYVLEDGTLSTTADALNVEAGRAISSTSLLLTSEAGAAGADGSDGIQGVQGIQGSAGLGIQFLGQVAIIGDLPTGSNTQGDAYIVQADDSLHVWDGTSTWVSGGSIQGPQGTQGSQGNVGSAGAAGADGAAGAAGAAGADGATGADFVASGALPDGTPVILNADGTVTSVQTVTITPETVPKGSSVIPNSTLQRYADFAFDPNESGKFVHVHTHTWSGSGYAVVGTRSSTNVSYSSFPGVQYDLGGGWNKAQFIKVSFDPNTPNSFVIAWSDARDGQNTTSQFYAIAGIRSGNTLTFGSRTLVYNSPYSGKNVQVAFDPNNAGKFVMAFHQQGSYSSTSEMFVAAGSVSGTTVTTAAPISVGLGGYMDGLDFDTNVSGRFAISYADSTSATGLSGQSNTGNAGAVMLGTLSGNVITLGTAYRYSVIANGFSWGVAYGDLAFDPNYPDRLLVAYTHVATTNGNLKVLTLSGTTVVSEGARHTWNNERFESISLAFNPSKAGQFVVSGAEHKDPFSNYKSVLKVGQIAENGTSISTSTEVLTDGVTTEQNVVFDPSNPGVFLHYYIDSNNSNRGMYRQGQLAIEGTNLTANNFIGTSTTAYADGATANITLAGSVSDNQSGLTTNSTYYVQTDGTIATTADTPSVELGRALSSTSLLLTSEAGAAGADGSDGIQGVQGIQGAAGLGIQFLGQVATVGDLSPSSNTQGDAYIVQADDSLHVWDGSSAWVSGGSIQGPQGIQGVQGNVGSAGAAGADGAATGATLPDPASEGTLFYTTGDDLLYISNGTAWSVVGGSTSSNPPVATGGTVVIAGINEGVSGSYDVDANFVFQTAAPFLAYSLSSGALPTGTALNSTTGVIAGTATHDGVYAFSVLATSDGGGSETQDYSWTIGDVVPTATGGTVAITGADGGTVISYDVDANFTFATGSAFSAFSLQSGALPAGTTLTASTGVISGTATNTNPTTTYAFTIRATDTDGDVVDQSYSWTITYVAPPSGETVFTTAGTYTWVAPTGVSSISVVMVGGGGGSSNGGVTAGDGGAGGTYAGGAGGGGGNRGGAGAGGLQWLVGQVTVGQTYTVVVGARGTNHGGDGGSSSFIPDSISLSGGGIGGAGGIGGGGGGGAGGAGGYSGNGGRGQGQDGTSSTSGSGGGGGGAGKGYSGSDILYGGGVGLYGQGANGAGASGLNPGGAGSGGTGKQYGGGASYSSASNYAGGGAVRIIWGPGRSFPSNAS